MSVAEIRTPSAAQSDLKIAAVEAYKLRLPYKKAVSFKSVKQAAGEFVLLRIVLDNGLDGLAESVFRPQHSGEDAGTAAYMIETFFRPLLVGADPMGHLQILHDLDEVKGCNAIKALIDVALWDLRGKILGQPVWRLLGGASAKPVPVAWIAHGNTVEGQIDEVKKMHETRGYGGMKLKTWRRSKEDLRMVEGVRRYMGEGAVLYCDGNSSYSETEARAILVHLADYGVSFMEDPCAFADPARQAALAAVLPMALLGDACCATLQRAGAQIRAGAVGAVNVKMRRTGLTQSLKLIGLCESAGIPCVIGTDSESRLAAMPRMHLRAAVPYLEPWPTETHFYDKLADDVFAGEFQFKDGTITPNDAPGFGAGFDRRKVEQYGF
jgi:L-alanine-DL-glutamate epimerase-like enolase superfamily enzyme